MLHVVTDLHYSTLHYTEVKLISFHCQICSLYYQYCVYVHLSL